MRPVLLAAALFGLGFSFPSTTAAAPALRGATSAATLVPSWSLSIPVPAGTAGGDVLLALVDVRVPASVPLGVPPGWTLVRRDNNPSGVGASLAQAIYYRVAEPREPATHTWSWTPSFTVGASGGIVAYAGIDQTEPIVGHSGLAMFEVATFAAPGLATSIPGQVLLGFFGSNGVRGITPPPELLERFEAVGPRVESEAADGVVPVTGAFGPRRTAAATQTPRTRE